MVLRWGNSWEWHFPNVTYPGVLQYQQKREENSPHFLENIQDRLSYLTLSCINATAVSSPSGNDIWLIYGMLWKTLKGFIFYLFLFWRLPSWQIDNLLHHRWEKMWGANLSSNFNWWTYRLNVKKFAYGQPTRKMTFCRSWKNSIISPMYDNLEFDKEHSLIWGRRSYEARGSTHQHLRTHQLPPTWVVGGLTEDIKRHFS